MRVLVTGGSGFIGGHVIDELIRKYHDPIVFDRHAHRASVGYEVFVGDIRDENAVQGAVGHAEAVIHLAGALGTQETIAMPDEAVMTNITGMLNVLTMVKLYDVPLVNIAVGNYWMENPYSISKNTAERLCNMYRTENGVQVATIRAMNAYGPRQVAAPPFGPSKVRKIIPAFVCRALSGMPIEIYGDGDQIMDMVYVTDLAEALVSAVGHNGNYECGSCRPTTVKEIATTVIEAVGEGELAHLPMRPGEPPNSTVLAKRERLLHATKTFVSLEDGVERTVAWFEENEGRTWKRPTA